MKKLVLLFLVVCLFSANKVLAVGVVDSDGDGLNDELELKLGTDVQNPDSDGDGFKDGEEVFNGYNPLVGDRDQSLKRRVEVDLSTQKIKYYFNNVLIGVAPVSTGVVGHDTPTGQFNIIRKLPVYRYVGPGYNLPNTKWNLEFKRSFYLHGAYWHNQFGIRPMSHGCVNIGYKDAEKIYKFLKVGDSVKISGKTPRHSLAKK
ncbi:MAG: L,D-transpeptidase family protein [Candidatus Magasanikbacteria bacterium]